MTGFGQVSFTDFNAPTPVMKQAHVPIVDMATKCVPSFSKLINAKTYLDEERELCAGGESEIDACTVSFLNILFGINR